MQKLTVHLRCVALMLGMWPAAGVAQTTSDPYFARYSTAARLEADCRAMDEIVALPWNAEPSVAQGAAAGRCYAYFEGFMAAEGIRAATDAVLGRRHPHFCVTGTNVSDHDLREAFLAYLAAHPERRADRPAAVLLDALSTRYPPSREPCG